ncbi:uncharacterized protein LOC115711634 [Cannabis sativa]|uniref:uncharacterized protein LOC115711634 n=1 Tax=Cannabis sativa TaxID=3483 RepID=UPI0029CA9503|nr:uncharacterized protein LOC115711634 [Cannabis sativa]
MISRTISKIVYSNGRRTGKSYAVAAASSVSVNKSEKGDEIVSSKPTTRLHSKRKCIAERRAVVEAFVDNYKATNGGKFPPPYLITQQTGGSYYLVKLIVQELQSESKSSVAVDNVNQNGLGKKKTKKTKEPSMRAKKLTKSNISVNLGVQDDIQTTSTNLVKIKSVVDKSIEAESSSLSSSSAEKTFPNTKEAVNIDGSSEFAAAQDSFLKGHGEINVSSCQKNVAIEDVQSKNSESVGVPSSVLQEGFGNVSGASSVYLENEKQNEDRAENDSPGFVEEGLQMMNTTKVLDASIENGDDNKQKSAASDDLDNYSKQTSVEEFVKKPSLWGNLKSFAGGIFNNWRKS